MPVRPWAAGSALALLISLSVTPRSSEAVEERIEERVDLGRNVIGMSVADLDGDGAREVVLVRSQGDTIGDGDGDPVVLEVWRDQGATWELVGREAVRRWNADARVLVPVDAARDGVNVIATRDQRAERLVLAVAGDTVEEPGGCCLTLADVSLVGGALRVEYVPQSHGAAESLWRLDFDGDGTDELLAMWWEQADTPEQQRVHYRILTRRGVSSYRAEDLPVPDAWQPAYHAFIGDTDGVPGDDIVITTASDEGVHRVAWSSGGIVTDSTDAATSREILSDGWIAGSVPGGRLLVTQPRGVTMLHWPRGAPIVEVARHETRDFAHVAVLGRGEHARILVMEAGGGGYPLPATTSVLDQRMQVELVVPPSEASEFLWRRGAAPGEIQGVLERFHAYTGPLPGGMAGGSDAVFVGGRLIAVAEDGSLDVSEASPLAGVWPSGLAGRDGGWMLTGDVWSGNREQVSLHAFFNTDATVELLPSAPMLAPDPAAGELEVTLEGAVPVPDAEVVVTNSEEGLAVTVDGPAGSDVTVLRDRVIVVTRPIGDEPATVVVEPRRSSDENQEFDVVAIMVTASGHVRVAEIPVLVLREAPGLTARTRVEPFSLSARVAGRVTQWASVTVDGREVEVGENGAYQVDVDAPIWPRDVVVVARDPVGNETVERIEIVGFVDYRGFPWALIVATVTVAFGLVMFVRTPRRREAEASATWDGAALEEIDGDQLP